MIETMNGNKSLGDVGSVLMQHNFDQGALRPYIESDGRTYIDLTKNGKTLTQVTNAPATLRKDQWQLVDTALGKVAKERLSLFNALASNGGTFRIPNGMGTTVLQHETMSDVGPATLSMDGITRGQADSPLFDLRNLPLPIVHYDFKYTLRQLETSRRNGTPLDTSTAELAGRRVAETVEKLTAGTLGTYKYGGGEIFGYANFPDRITYGLTTPTGVATNVTTLNEVLGMMQVSRDANYNGPWTLYVSTKWSQFMENDYSADKSDLTLRQRLSNIHGITDVADADYLNDFDMVLVQNTSDVARAVVALPMTTMQWPTMGGMEVNFKVMAIMVPQLRSDYNNATGIVHGTI